MPADRDCQKAYNDAKHAAEAAAQALGVKLEKSPLVNNLARWKGEIPDGANKDLKNAFIAKMKQIEKVAQDLNPKATPPAPPPRSLEQAVKEANEAAEAAKAAAIEAANALEHVKALEEQAAAEAAERTKR